MKPLPPTQVSPEPAFPQRKRAMSDDLNERQKAIQADFLSIPAKETEIERDRGFTDTQLLPTWVQKPDDGLAPFNSSEELEHPIPKKIVKANSNQDLKLRSGLLLGKQLSSLKTRGIKLETDTESDIISEAVEP